jgi:hypothetical protein
LQQQSLKSLTIPASSDRKFPLSNRAAEVAQINGNHTITPTEVLFLKVPEVARKKRMQQSIRFRCFSPLYLSSYEDFIIAAGPTSQRSL